MEPLHSSFGAATQPSIPPLRFAVSTDKRTLMSSALCLPSSVVSEARSDSKVVRQIRPLEDPRWDEFLTRHPDASLFHSRPWLQALFRTYGYKSLALTTSPVGQPLKNAIVFCAVESWLTGRRLVSLPFSDHCEPLLDKEDDLKLFADALERECRNGHWRYVELRPLKPFELETSLCHATLTYSFHKVDLQPDPNALFRNFHKNSTQRKIRRAEREGIAYREGSTESLLDNFYGLFMMTRRRHKLPAPSRTWFRHLMAAFGKSLQIRIAYQNERPVAGMVTIRYKDTLVYKYGGSDSRFTNLGGMHLLFWKSIQEAKESGLNVFDLGRTDLDQSGLITFKSRWGAHQSLLTYSRYSPSGSVTHLLDLPGRRWKSVVVKHVLAHVQPGVLSAIGRLLYRHVG